mmetsp:Transcript_12388/g.40791  ORF Transcript_12388/g.40791 Transcript_12388/m.40791 type:complete len:388 (-) Transcript_12388:1086-2249(-)
MAAAAIGESFRDLYVSKCRDFLCEPIAPLLAAVDEAISLGVKLSYIKLNGNSKELFGKRVEYMQVFALAESLHDIGGIEELDLSYNGIDDAGAATLQRMLKLNKSIKVLNLAGNSIGGEGTAKLAEALSEPGGGGAGVESLSLRGNPIGEEGGQAMAAMLRANKTLASLDLGDAELGMKSVVSIATALNEENRTLRHVGLGKVLISSLGGEGSVHLARMLAANDSLESLVASKHKMRAGDLETLVAYGLVANKTLARLDLAANELCEVAGSSLARLLTDNASITHLDLAHNRLSDTGASAIAAVLSYNRSLTHLDLSHNRLNDKGLLALADGLKFNTHLRYIKLKGNCFGPESSAAFLALLQQRAVQLHTDIAPYVVDDKIYVAVEH